MKSCFNNMINGHEIRQSKNLARQKFSCNCLQKVQEPFEIITMYLKERSGLNEVNFSKKSRENLLKIYFQKVCKTCLDMCV